MFEQLIAITAPVMICAAIGYTWARLGRPYNTEMVTHLVSSIGVPCLVFSTLVKVDIELSALGEMAVLAFASLVVMGVMGWIVVAVLLAGTVWAIRASKKDPPKMDVGTVSIADGGD